MWQIVHTTPIELIRWAFQLQSAFAEKVKEHVESLYLQ